MSMAEKSRYRAAIEQGLSRIEAECGNGLYIRVVSTIRSLGFGVTGSAAFCLTA